MSLIAFYRNMNLGHKKSPNRSQLELAFHHAGASTARSYQTNGTVVFTSDRTADHVIADVTQQLTVLAGYDDAAFVRSADELIAILDRDPFAGFTDERTHRESITFFGEGPSLSWDIPWTNRLDNLDIIEFHPTYALSVTRLRLTSPGNPTAELESRIGGPATTRTMGTIARLCKSIPS